MNKRLSGKTALAVGLALIVLALLTRMMPHPPNVAPITAVALFGAAVLPRRFSLLLPLLAMIVSDFFIGFHDTIIWTWGSFAVIGLFGYFFLRNDQSPLRLAAASLSASIFFFVVTNFGVWMQGFLYPRTLDGLASSYTAAIPFFRNTLIGDAFYTFAIFGLYAFAIKAGNHLARTRQVTNL